MAFYYEGKLDDEFVCQSCGWKGVVDDMTYEPTIVKFCPICGEAVSDECDGESKE